MAGEHTLWFRVDASPSIGTGHVMRCLAIAEAWIEHGGTAAFVGDCPPRLLRRSAVLGIRHVAVPARHPDPKDLDATLRTVPAGAPLVLDGYGFDAAFQAAVRAGHPLVVIDDTGHLPAYDCDLLVNHNVDADRIDYPLPATACLVGPRVFPLRAEFRARCGRRREVRAAARRVLVTLGGTDPGGHTAGIVEGLVGGDLGVEVRVVLGPLAGSGERLDELVSAHPRRVQRRDDARDMPDLMAWADVAVAGGGTTSLELAFMGLPSVLLTLAENQVATAAGLARLGAALDLGPADALGADRCRDATAALLGDRRRRARMSACGHDLVDGHGASRLVERIRSLTGGWRRSTR